MKARYKYLFYILFLLAALWIISYIQNASDTPSCGSNEKENEVVITSSNITTGAGNSIDITALFSITSDGEAVAVTYDMLELGGLSPEMPAVGEYTVTLTYISPDGKRHEAASVVRITEDGTVEVVIRKTDISILEGDTFNISNMFAVTENGESVEISDTEIDLGGYDAAIQAVGEYTVRLTYISTDSKTHEAYATLTVRHRVIVSITATAATIYEGEDIPDVTSLFKITADGDNVNIREEMIDIGELDTENTKAGDYLITLKYESSDGITHTKTAYLHIIHHWIPDFE